MPLSLEPSYCITPEDCSLWEEFKAGKIKEEDYEPGYDAEIAIRDDDYDTLREMLAYEFTSECWSNDQDLTMRWPHGLKQYWGHTMLELAIYHHNFTLSKMVIDTLGDYIDYARQFRGGDEIGECTLLSFACATDESQTFIYMLNKVDLTQTTDSKVSSCARYLDTLMVFIVDRHPNMLKAFIECTNKGKPDGIPFLEENHSNYKTNELTVALYRGLFWTFIENNGQVNDNHLQIGKMLNPLLDMDIVRDVAKYGDNFDKDSVRKPDCLEDELNEFFSTIFESYTA